MFSLPRWFASVLPHGRSARRAETYPPLAWPNRRAWSTRLGQWLGSSAWAPAARRSAPSFRDRSRNEALAVARLEFADALIDVRTAAAAMALDRIAITRSMHELWHFREEVFSLVACRHSQAEASRRLAALDQHFPKRTLR